MCMPSLVFLITLLFCVLLGGSMYFEANEGSDPEEGRPQAISGKEFKKMMLEDMEEQEAEKQDVAEETRSF